MADDQNASDPELEELRSQYELAHLRKQYEAMKAAKPSDPTDGITADDVLSKANSAMRGAAKGITYGFADEAAGRLMAAKQALLGEDAGLPWEDLVRTNVAAVRKADDQARAENPKTFIASNVVGSVASPASKMLAPAKGAGLMAKMASGARAGALLGLGESTASADDDPLHLAKDALYGGAIGGATGGVLHGAGKVAGGLNAANLNRLADAAAKAKPEAGQGFSVADMSLGLASMFPAMMHGSNPVKSAMVAGGTALVSKVARKVGPAVAEKTLRGAAKLSDAIGKSFKPITRSEEVAEEILPPGVFKIGEPPPIGNVHQAAMAPYGLAEEAMMASPEDLARQTELNRKYAADASRIELDRRMRKHQQALQDQGINLRLDSEESLNN